MQAILQARMGNSWWDKRAEETGPQWAERLQSLLSKEVARKKASGIPSAQLLLRLPPLLLVKLYAIIFSCSDSQAAEQIDWERRKNGFLQLLGQVVISDKTVVAPEIQEMGKVQDIKKRLKDVKSRFGGSLTRKKQA